MTNNVVRPVFGAVSSGSGNANAQSYWGGVDNFDVDMLAEYLLDDVMINANGVSFDFA